MPPQPLYMRDDGDRQRDPRPAGDSPTARVRQPENPVARGPDRSRNGPQSPVFRRQEPRLLDSPVDRLGRLLLFENALGFCQQSWLDAPRPHASSDGDGLFADPPRGILVQTADQDEADRKSTRLNSSHPSISYAVFCLKKKRK